MVIFLFCALQSITAFTQANDPVLFEVADDAVHLSEFTYIYEKNNADKADYSKESLNEYLELYKKFKLKVKRARAIGLDTVQALNDELAGYRSQLAKSYLKDKEISERLVTQVMDRMEQDVEVSHIFVSASPRARKESIEAAEQKIADIYDKVQENDGKYFETMAQTLSEDKISSKKGGRLGYYTAPLPDGFYNFENAMYETEVGKVSKPIRSKMGFHILKVSDKRPARGQLEISHILIRKEKSASVNTKDQILADSVYNLVKDGRSFENMAAKFSDDLKTKSNGGYLGFFGINQYEASFENAAFGLAEDGDVSRPIQTKLGYHIIKRISKRDNSDKEKLKKRIENRIRKDDRFVIAEEKLLEDVKKQAGFREEKLTLKRFTTALNSDFYSYKWEQPSFNDNLNLFTLGEETYTLNDFASYVKTNIRERLKFSKNKPVQEAGEEMYDSFLKEKVMAYEENNLEKKYPDFKSLMQEYREGILLFEITKQEVWDKASQDSTGLKKFYNNNANQYMWPERANVYKYTITSTKKDDATAAYQYAQKKGHDKFIKKYENDDETFVKFTKETVSKEDKAVEGMTFGKKSVSKLTHSGRTSTFYRFVESVKPVAKTLSEARGYVIADYQDYLESNWVKELMKTYPIKVDQKVLKSITK